jgi:hypothetical protein
VETTTAQCRKGIGLQLALYGLCKPRTEVVHDCRGALGEDDWARHFERVALEFQALDALDKAELWWDFADRIVAQIQARYLLKRGKIVDINLRNLPRYRMPR